MLERKAVIEARKEYLESLHVERVCCTLRSLWSSFVYVSSIHRIIYWRMVVIENDDTFGCPNVHQCNEDNLHHP